MNPDLLSDIQHQLKRYLSREISLDQFREWFDVETWDVIDDAPAATQALSGEVELRIAEFTNGHRTEDDLRYHLESLVPDADFQVNLTRAEPHVEMISA